MSTDASVFVIILNYNGGDAVLSCVESVFRSRNIMTHVVIVDNASTDQSFEHLRGRFPRATFIRNEQNIGFAAGNNVGIRFALERHADYVVLVNNDATLDPDAIARLVAAGEGAGRPAVLCPLIATLSGRPWFAGAIIDWFRMRTHHVTLATPDTTTVVVPTPVATGCVMAIHRSVFRRIGLLNESYFLYYEDADFSLCATRANCLVGIVPRAHAVHREASMSPRRSPLRTYWLVLSGLLFCSAHAPLPYRMLYTILIPLRHLYAISHKGPRGAQVRRAFHDFAAARRRYVHHR